MAPFVSHWIEDDNLRIIAIYNGELSNRSVGMKMNKMGNQVWKE